MAEVTPRVVPVVSSVNPGSGPQTGGTPVTINGSGLTGATAVTFGGVAATALVVVNDTTITCTTPAGSGVAPIAVTTPGGTGTAAAIFEYTLFSNFPAVRTSGIGIDATGHVWINRNGAWINMGIPPSWTPGLLSESPQQAAIEPPPASELEEPEPAHANRSPPQHRRR
jgi:hypothetical protein